MKALLNGRLALVTDGARVNAIAPGIIATVFLCSDWASYVTGAMLAVDGGYLAF